MADPIINPRIEPPRLLQQHQITFNGERYLLVEVYPTATTEKLYNFSKEYIFSVSIHTYVQYLPYNVLKLDRVSNLTTKMLDEITKEIVVNPLATDDDKKSAIREQILLNTTIRHESYITDYVLFKEIVITTGEYSPSREDAYMTELEQSQMEDFLYNITNIEDFVNKKSYAISYRSVITTGDNTLSYREVFLNRVDIADPIPVLRIYNNYKLQVLYNEIVVDMLKIHDYLTSYDLIQFINL